MRSADETFDLELLLDGFEKEFDLPAVFIDLGDGGGRPCEVVGQEHNDFAGFRVFGPDAAQTLGEFLAGVKPFEFNDVI